MTSENLKSIVISLIFAFLAVWAFGAGHLFAPVVLALASAALFILAVIIVIREEKLKNGSKN